MPAKYWRYALILLIFVGGGGLIFYFSLNGEADAVGVNQKKPVNTDIAFWEHVVSPQNTTRGISLIGVTAPKREEVIYIPSQIQIDQSLVAIGEHVEAGDKLVALDEISYTAVIGNSRAIYLEQLQNYSRAKNWQTSSEITRMKNSLEEIKLRLDQSKKSLESVKTLLDKGLVPRLEYENNKLSVLRDELALENAKNELNTQLSKGKENLEIAELRFRAAESTWSYFKENYPDAFVRAPISGYVGRPPGRGKTTQTDPEGSGSLSGKPVFTIFATDRLLIQAYVGEKDVNNITIGQSVQIKDMGGRSVSISGQVSAISRVNSSNDKSFPRFELLVEIDPKELGENLRFGLSASIFIETQITDQAILIPINALNDDGTGPYVIIKSKSGGGAEKMPVEIGKATYNNIEILSGLNNGDIVLVAEK